ncbi:ATP-dependent DNA helicase RecQ [Periweissella fabaria]|uniref:ATP-dependent RNA helicase DbpA n=1 Tax=Periweissella fabaria TaxID=546157 RepID=A0ABN8BGY5_9LACO|nr:RecQ family ATP-dependent DNA helicase [Periweissella fabaria]MCM0596428.1 ATP-dependent DNA helicase RecQ [Periweissella fabaria]CAH0415844.1 ATP-dependent RNA helicase DbpA [Periweissella fabaria]
MSNFNDQLRAYLQQHYHFDDFRPGQAEVLTALLERHEDVLAVLPTGTGKSLIYELAGRYLGGLTVIVSPLLSLMQDQVARLNAHGIRRTVALNSMQHPRTKYFILQNLAKFDYLFIAPETLTQPGVLEALAQQTINLLVVDEAHSIAQWGPDFRPDYLEIGRAYAAFKHPRLLLLTATAGEKVRAQIQSQFELTTPLTEFVYSVNRPNIHLRTEKLANEQEKHARLLALVRELPGPGIIYLSSKKQANQLRIDIQQKTERKVATYHGDIENEQRFAIQQQFMQNQLDVIVATSAFGMGIDKADVRWVIHYHMASDLESYLQEIGRAGRDQQPAVAILLYTETDDYLVNNLLISGIPDEVTIKHFYLQTPHYVFEPQQLRLLQYYAAQGLDAQAVMQLFQRRLLVKRLALQQMVQYIEITTEKRNYLLRVFGEAELTGAAAGNWSTQATPLEIPSLHLPVTESNNASANIDWQKRLEKLFNQ